MENKRGEKEEACCQALLKGKRWNEEDETEKRRRNYPRVESLSLSLSRWKLKEGTNDDTATIGQHYGEEDAAAATSNDDGDDSSTLLYVYVLFIISDLFSLTPPSPVLEARAAVSLLSLLHSRSSFLLPRDSRQVERVHVNA